MKATKFKHQNVIFAEDQEEYISLPALKIEGKEGNVITCWKLSFIERIRILFGKRIYLDLMTFNNPLQPIKMSTKRKDIFTLPEE